MKPVLKFLLIGCAVAIVGFCAFGFLATFEPNPPSVQWTWRLIYLVIAAGCAVGTVRFCR